MLVLDNIVKNYSVGDSEIQALKGVGIRFREGEFVSILGPSGCGKTTLLNIIGGLDHYTAGDLVINGKSTKDFTDSDWDVYRNRSIGFVFQSYNLIPHQSVLSNVELAMTLSGVSKQERRRRAEEALKMVGLDDQLHKKPNQMSGGQMQRVAIARALVNNPDILLADEPTGALDTETSVQVMEILKEVSKERLVIMVTHNPDLAEKYSTRIIRLLDGQIVSDSMPFTGNEVESAEKPGKKGRTLSGKKQAMSFLTAVSLSLNNLMTKKGRTLLTAFAGSIGIIGIALILSISTGVNKYINRVQEDTLSSYPITLEAESVDMSGMVSSLMGVSKDADNPEHDRDAVYTSSVMYELMNSMYASDVNENNLKAFKKFLDSELYGSSPTTTLKNNASAVQYQYDLDLNIYTNDTKGDIIKSDFMALWESMFSSMTGTQAEGSDAQSMMKMYSSFGSSSGFKIWEEMLKGDNGNLINPILNEQYDVIAGNWPKNYNEVVLIVNKNNEISDMVLYALGMKDTDEMYNTMKSVMSGQSIDTSNLESWNYDEILGKTFKVIPSALCYQMGDDGKYTDISKTDLGLKTLYDSGTELKIVGIIRQNEDSVSGMMSGAIGYTSALTDYVIEQDSNNDMVKKQLAEPKVDVFTGLPFASDTNSEPTDSDKVSAIKEYFTTISNAQKAEIYTSFMSVPTDEYISGVVEKNMQGMTRDKVEQMVAEKYPEYKSMLSTMDDETLFGYVRQMMSDNIKSEYASQVQSQLGAYTTDQLAAMFDAKQFTQIEYVSLYDKYMPATVSDSNYEDNMKLLGYVDTESPSVINIYADTFESKDAISNIISDYNDSVSETDKISYTDYVALLMSSITTVINAISYVLIAFVAISLVVSSIMIGIITYISVLERTKEIGILRAIGASKRDISRVFNAETLLVGLCAGIIGIVITLLLCIPANAIIHSLTGIAALNAVLPTGGAVILIVISILLTVVAGLIPSRIAAKKDPVAALRTE